MFGRFKNETAMDCINIYRNSSLWYGVCGVAWHCVVCGMVWRGVVWHSMVVYGMVHVAWRDVTWHGVTWRGMV